ncbi:MAG: SDR family NAD(P)-dependent oxidoreductase [Chloroflexi bacterium]|nr:SDR family NAD(P)-dependent oxidoreductase [Chloroflexota bacterium]MDA1148299.1 SDR family NAD(P)-dependent oxidoreductase [Chloroflexota bacterium]
MTRWLARAVDAVLEATILLSFSSIGYHARRRLFGWTPLSRYNLGGRVVLVTGGTSGLGRAAAEQFARLGATVILLGRNAEKTQHTANELMARTGNDSIDAVTADMGDLDSVRRVAATIRDRHERLDVLIHNAGALAATRTLAPDGSEITIASQLLGPFLLTGLLYDLLARAAPGRVITVSSGGMYTSPLSVAALEASERDDEAKPFDGAKQYARVKRAQVVNNELWADRVSGDQVLFHATHPGWVDTPGLRESLPTFSRLLGPILRTPGQGVDTIVWLGSDDGAPLVGSGRFWHDRRPRSTHRLPSSRRADNSVEREQLWAFCVRRTNWNFLAT